MFFTHLDQVLTQGIDLNITVSKTETGMVVLLMPKLNGLKDPAQNHIVPLQLSGQPQELDANFFPHITQPVQKVSGLLVSMEQFEKQAEKAAAESKAAKQKKDAEAKSAKAKEKTDAKPVNDKKDKYESHMNRSEEHEAAGNLDASLLSLQQARLYAEDDQTKTVDERIAEIKSKMSQGSLFDAPPSQPQQTAATQSTPQQAATARTIPAPPAPPNAAPAQSHGLFDTAQQAQPTLYAQMQVQPPQQPMPPVQATPQQMQGAQAPIQQTPQSEQQQIPQPPVQPAMQQPVQQQPEGIQPNVQGFGMFSQQPVNAPQNVVLQPQAPEQQVPQQPPMQAATAQQSPQPLYDHMPRHNIPKYGEVAGVPVCREREYEEYEDFPPEMAPPAYQPPQPQNAY